LVIIIPFILIKQKTSTLTLPLLCFACLGIGFMIIEVSMFQKLILYLGSPTISLAILLSALLVSMGIGSYAGNRIYTDSHQKRIHIVSLGIVITGTLIFFLSQYILNIFLKYTLFVRIIISVILILPFGFLLGSIFPSCIQLLKSRQLSAYIPWMYSINGTMSVSGSILAVIISMIFGFTVSFFIGLFFYAIIFMLSRINLRA
jgi:MFS family permease